MLKQISVFQLNVPPCDGGTPCICTGGHCKMPWMRMLMFPSAQVLKAVLVWAVVGLSNNHIVKVLSNQDKAANKTIQG